MAERLFPSRVKCKACGKKLGAGVVLGLYCGWKCAPELVAPATDVESAPKQCRTQRDGKWVFKKRYRYAGEADPRLLADKGMDPYWCTRPGGCGQLHFGRSLVRLEGTVNKSIKDRAGLAEALVRARGKASLRQVGSAVGVRPIRISEWEDPGFADPSLPVLWKLLRAYRIDLVAVFN